MRVFKFATGLAIFFSVLSAKLADALLRDRVPLLGDFVGLQYSLNPGIAWGIRLPADVQEAAIGIALIVVIVLAYRERSTSYHNQIPYGFIVGGGFANIMDRLPDGVVTDYVQVGTFPIFNVADSFVTVGVVLLFWFSFLRETAVPSDQRK